MTLFSGCAAPPGQGITTISPASGPLRDIPAGVRATASMHELAVLGGIISPDDPNTLIISLVSVKDERAELILVMPDGWRDAPNPLMPQDMRMRIGRFGHPDRERRFLADLQRRLETVAASPTASAPLPGR